MNSWIFVDFCCSEWIMTILTTTHYVFDMFISKHFFFYYIFQQQKKEKKNIETSFFRWFLISQLKYSREDIEEYFNKSHENAIILSYIFVCLFCFFLLYYCA